jgi:hypothetical protein
MLFDYEISEAEENINFIAELVDNEKLLMFSTLKKYSINQKKGKNNF